MPSPTPPSTEAERTGTSFAGHSYLITGAQKGIGAALTVELARRGASVAVNYLDDAGAAEAIVAEARGCGADAVAVQGDVSSKADVEAMVTAACKAFGGLDGLINNAGIFPRAPLLDIAEAEWDQVLSVNLKGTFLATQAAAKAMIEAGRRGVIVNLSSAASRRSPMGAHYGASKGAIESFTRTAAIELASHGIRVNAVAPGIVMTDQPRGYWSDDEIKALGRKMLLGRVGTVTDVVNCALFLLSDAAAYVTGQTLGVDGGGV